MNAHWEQRPPPDVAPRASWSGAPRTAAELTALRGQLHTALRDGPLAIGADADAVENVLLAFEELASNGLRHGRPPVHVTVTATGAGGLLEVSDAADDRPPTQGAPAGEAGGDQHVPDRLEVDVLTRAETIALLRARIPTL